MQGQSLVFKVQAFAPAVPVPLWTFLPNPKQGLQNYVANWFDSSLTSVLGMAPIVCAPDGHEYWNNYPGRVGSAKMTIGNGMLGSSSTRSWCMAPRPRASRPLPYQVACV